MNCDVDPYPVESFKKERTASIKRMAEDGDLKSRSMEWLKAASPHTYPYNFSWLGRPILQMPQDIIALQEIIWEVKPDLIIETGIAHGGSLVFFASMLELLGNNGRVLGIDIDIRRHNRLEIEKNPMSKRITMLEGSSIDPSIVKKVENIAKNNKNIMVCLDSSHTHAHVMTELENYSPLVSTGSYLVVFDTVIEFFDPVLLGNRPWGIGNNPYTAVQEFLSKNQNFIADHTIEDKLLLTACPGGYLKKVR